jgi:methylthioribulose-1-phosphate dehydratase
MTEPRTLTEELLDAIGYFHRAGHTPATSSNFSVRGLDSGFWVSESSRDKGSMRPEHFLHVAPTGVPVGEEARKPSAETGLHAAVYAECPEARSVLHTHSVAATVLSLERAKQGCVALEGYELLKALGGVSSHEVRVDVPVFANTQDIPALAREVGAWLREERAFGRPAWGFLIAGHGTYAWGRSVAEAKRHLEAFEFLFQVELMRAQRAVERGSLVALRADTFPAAEAAE